MLNCKISDLPSLREQNRLTSDDDGLSAFLNNSCKAKRDSVFLLRSDTHRDDCDPRFLSVLLDRSKNGPETLAGISPEHRHP